MQTIQFNDVDAKGKFVIATFGGEVDGAGNPVSGGIPTFKSTNPDVATVENAPADSGGAPNPWAMKVTFTGKNGSCDAVITDGDLSNLITFVINTTAATGIGDAVVSDLQG